MSCCQCPWIMRRWAGVVRTENDTGAFSMPLPWRKRRESATAGFQGASRQPVSGNVPGGKDLPIRNSRLDTVREIKRVFAGENPPCHQETRQAVSEPQMAGCLTGRSCHLFSGYRGWCVGTTPFPVRLPKRTGDDSGRASLFGFTLLLTSEITAQLACQIFPQIFGRARQKFPGHRTCRGCLAEHDISFKNGHRLATDRYRDTLCHSSTALLRFTLG